MKQLLTLTSLAVLLVGCGGGGGPADYENPLEVIEDPARFVGTGPGNEPAFPPQQPPSRTPELFHPVDGNSQPTDGNPGGGNNCASVCQGNADCLEECEDICNSSDPCDQCICSNLTNLAACTSICSDG